MASEIIFLCSLGHRGTLRLIFDAIDGIRSLSEVPIKVIAPVSDASLRSFSSSFSAFIGVEVFQAETIGAGREASTSARPTMLALLRQAATLATGDTRHLLVFVGEQPCGNSLVDCEFFLRRRFASQPVFFLVSRTTVRCDAGQGDAVETISLDERRIESVARMTLLAFEPGTGQSASHAMALKVLPHPQAGVVEPAARRKARASLGLFDEEFALVVKRDEAPDEGLQRRLALVGALMQARSTRLVALGDRDGRVADWIDQLPSDLRNRTIIVAWSNETRAVAAQAADMLITCTGNSACPDHRALTDTANESVDVPSEAAWRVAILQDDEWSAEVDDFIAAVGMLPSQAFRPAEMLRDAFIRTLRIKTRLRFGRSFYSAVT